MDSWQRKLRFDPLPALLSARSEALRYFARRDLLEDAVPAVESLWALPEARRLIERQQGPGCWRYPGGRLAKRARVEDYDMLETFRSLGILVEEYGLDRRSPAILRAADYLFSCQTPEGDFRGILGRQYTPYYSAAFMELLVKAGFGDDPRIKRGFAWLLGMRQADGAWALPLRTMGCKLDLETLAGQTLRPDRSKPFSHLITGVVLRAFAAHPHERHSPEARASGAMLAERFFLPDCYPDRQAASFWTSFSFPFWFTDLLSSLDSLTRLGFTGAHPQVQKAVGWLARHQGSDGLWDISMLRGKHQETRAWIGLAICRVLKRLG